MDGQYLVITYNVLPVIFLIVGGRILSYFDFFAANTVEELKKIVVNIGLPALLFTAFSSVSFTPRYLAVFGFSFFVCVGFYYVGKGIGKLLGLKSRMFPFLMTGFEAGMLGYPIFQATFGKGELFKFSIVDFGHEVFVFLVFVPLIIKMSQKERAEESAILMFLKSPPIIGILFGLLFGSLGLFEGVSDGEFVGVILTTLDYLGALVVPLICIVIGYELEFNPSGLKKAVITTALRLTLAVIVGVLLGKFVFLDLLGFGRTFFLGFITLLVLPPPFVIPVFLEPQDEEENQFVLNTLSVHTIGTLIIYIPLMILLV
ncbi:MAG: AEC family transporter [Candidatus Bipolaricaulota bacterium]